MPIIKNHDVTLSSLFEGNTITLRPLTDEHLPYLYKWNSDSEVLYWTEGGEDIVRSYDKETVHDIYGGVSKSGHCFLVVLNDEPIGECWLQQMNIPEIKNLYPSLDVRRIDMAIGEKQYWDKGIGTIFVGILVEFAFSVEKVDLLHCFSEDYNYRSQKVWLKNGFRLVKSEELTQPQKGKIQYHYELARAEYKNRNK
jgi:RimJ/RimL family protein N-acetyltransferase